MCSLGAEETNRRDADGRNAVKKTLFRNGLKYETVRIVPSPRVHDDDVVGEHGRGGQSAIARFRLRLVPAKIYTNEF